MWDATTSNTVLFAVFLKRSTHDKLCPFGKPLFINLDKYKDGSAVT
jgi:hypothetical protein